MKSSDSHSAKWIELPADEVFPADLQFHTFLTVYIDLLDT